METKLREKIRYKGPKGTIQIKVLMEKDTQGRERDPGVLYCSHTSSCVGHRNGVVLARFLEALQSCFTS